MTPTDATSDLERNPIDRLAEEFVERQRRGEYPSLTEYASRYPELAEEIRDLFPALVVVERLKPVGEDPSGTAAALPGPLTALVGGVIGQLGDFQLIRELGRGGMGVVYEAVQESMDRRVALKVLARNGRLGAGQIERFRLEARSAGQLHHGNIVPIHGVGEHEGVYYYAMQFIEGHGLDAILHDLRRLRGVEDASAAAGPDDGRTQRTDGRTASMALARSLMAGGLERPEASADRTAALSPTTVESGPDASPLPRPASSLMFPREHPGGGTGETPPEDPGRRPTDSTASELSLATEARFYQAVARIGLQVAEALAYAHQHGVLHRDIKPSNLLLDVTGNVWVTDFGLAKVEGSDGPTRTGDIVGTIRYMAPERFDGWSDRRSDVYSLGTTLYELLTLHPIFPGAAQAELLEKVLDESPVAPRNLDPRIPRDLETIVLKAIAKEPADRYPTAQAMGEDLRRFLEDRPVLARRSTPVERFVRWCRRNPGLAAANLTAAVLIVFVAVSAPIVAWSYRFQLERALAAERQRSLELGKAFQAEGTALQRSGLVGQRFESLNRLGRAAKVLGADPEGQKRVPEIRDHAIAALGLTDLRVRWEHTCGPDVFPRFSFDAAMERYAVVERSGAVVVRRREDNRELVRLPGPERRDYWFAFPQFSPDGELLVTGYVRTEGEDYLLRVWHLGRRELLSSLLSRGGLEFHPDGRRVLFHAPEGGIAIWDRERRRVVRRLPLDFAPSLYALDPDGRRLAVNNTDAEKPRLVLLEFETGRVLADWRTHVGIRNLAWSADGQLLAVGSHAGDGRVYVWDVRRRALASVLQGHSGDVILAQFAHSGFLLATTSWDGTTRLWDAASGELLVAATGHFSDFSADDRGLAFRITDSGKFGIWDVAAASECRALHPGMIGNRTERRDDNATGVDSSDFSPDGRLVATGDGDGVRLWEAETDRELAHLRTGSCDTVLFHPDGRSLISAGRWGLYRWPIRPDPERGADALRVGPPELLSESESGRWNHATWLPDHRTVALVDNAHARILLVDSSHPQPARSRATVLDTPSRNMKTIAASPDGRWLAVGGWKDAGVRIWDLRRRRFERLLRPQDTVGDTSIFIGFSPDGCWLASFTGSDSRVAYDFWRVGTWALDRRIDTTERGGGGPYPPVFTRDGRLMALGIAPDQVMLADSATGRELARLTTLHPVQPSPLAFSSDGSKLVARTREKTALVWDLRRIRDQLAPMGLDWGTPRYPVASSASEVSGPVPPPRPVRVVGEVIEPQARRAAELAEMDRRLAVAPDDADALIHRGWLRLGLSKPAESVADLERALRLWPDDADARLLLARAYRQSNNPAAERAALETYLARSADDCDARLRKGVVAFQLGRIQEAADDLTRVLDADPGVDRAHYWRAQAWLRLGRFQEALNDLDPLIRHYPQDPSLHDLRGRAHERLGHREQAEADRKQAVESPLALAQHFNNLAWRLATAPAGSRDPEQALTLARKAVALAPDRGIFLNTLGVAEYRAGRYAEAVATLEKSLAASRGQTDAFDLFFLAMARCRLGQLAQARADFDQAIRWRREHPNLSQPGWPAELAAFRAEAEEVLASLVGELPADVFAAP